jgi:hypothetical protein
MTRATTEMYRSPRDGVQHIIRRCVTCGRRVHCDPCDGPMPAESESSVSAYCAECSTDDGLYANANIK